MTAVLIAFIVGLTLGGSAGILVISLTLAAKRADEWQDWQTDVTWEEHA